MSHLHGPFSNNVRPVAAGIVIVAVTVIVVFMLFRREYIQGLADAVKG